MTRGACCSLCGSAHRRLPARPGRSRRKRRRHRRPCRRRPRSRHRSRSRAARINSFAAPSSSSASGINSIRRSSGLNLVRLLRSACTSTPALSRIIEIFPMPSFIAIASVLSETDASDVLGKPTGILARRPARRRSPRSSDEPWLVLISSLRRKTMISRTSSARPRRRLSVWLALRRCPSPREADRARPRSRRRPCLQRP